MRATKKETSEQAVQYKVQLSPMGYLVVNQSIETNEEVDLMMAETMNVCIKFNCNHFNKKT